MKISYFSDSAIPSRSPNSVHVMKMGQALATLDNRVVLHCKLTTQCLPALDIHAFYDVKPVFNIKRFPWGMFPGSGRMYNYALPGLVWMENYDVAYCRSLIAAFYSTLFRRPTIFEMHEPFDKRGAKLHKMFVKVINDEHCRIVVISDALRQYLITSYAVPETRILVCHDAADPIDVSVEPFSTNRFSVGYVGSLYPGKGMELISTISGKLPKVDFHIVGGLPEQIAQWKERLGDVKNVIFHGFRTQKELPKFLLSYDVLIAPYQSTVVVSENKGSNNLALWMSPLKLFEYMSSGKPIVTTRLPVIEEIIEHGSTGILCDADDPDNWVEEIERLRNDSALRNRLASEARKKFVKHHTWVQRSKEIVEFIGHNFGIK